MDYQTNQSGNPAGLLPSMHLNSKLSGIVLLYPIRLMKVCNYDSGVIRNKVISTEPLGNSYCVGHMIG